jgi:DNA polymerase I-like protein with 3'-5' exonuclease and polymerase domains/uracil-DNA glycosylase
MEIRPTGPTTARIMIVGEFPGEQDLFKGSPLCGGGGWELSKMLQEAGTFRENCYVTLVVKERVAGGKIEGLIAQTKGAITSNHTQVNGKWVTEQVAAGIDALKREIELVRPNVVIALGNLALFALTGEWGVDNWRSSIMESNLVQGLKVIPTLPPSRINQVWALRPIMVHDLKRAVRQSLSPAINRTQYDFQIRPTFEQARDQLESLIVQALQAERERRYLEIAGDIETRAGHIACIAFAWNERQALCIPFMCQHNPEGYWTLNEETELIYLIYQLSRICRIIGQNWNYDAQYIHRWWHFLFPDVVDTMVQQHSCFSSMEKSLSFLSSMYLEDHLYWKDDRTNWETGPKGEGEDQYWIYNCTDTVRTYAIKQVLDKVIVQMGMQAVNEFQQRLAPRVLKTMNRGIRSDETARASYGMQLMQAVHEREEWLEATVGHPLNIKSPVQMKDFFYREMNQKPIISKKTRNPTCDDEALQRIAAREPILKPITQCISELRSLGVFHSTFVQAPLDTDGRIRTSFNICGTETYRFASAKNAFGTGLNVQNIPKGSEPSASGFSLPNVRKLFIPDPGNTFFDIDLDSADLRIVTFESDCGWMKEQFREGRKPYVEIMKEYYHDQSITKHHKSYPMFKALCHGTNYLGTAAGIAPRIGLNVAETERIQKWYYGLCPEIKAWQDRIKHQVPSRRYVENAFGYRMYFFDRIEGTIFNQAVAWIPQSTVACLINRAYANIDDNLPEVEILLQVHDSLAGQFPTHLGDWALRRIVEESPVGIVSSTKSWGDCE